MIYSNKLRSSFSQRNRLEIMKRDGFKCCICKKSEVELIVHQLYHTPKNKPWKYDSECFVTLCKDCHTYVHNEFSKIIALIAFKAIKSGLSLTEIDNLLNPYTNDTSF